MKRPSISLLLLLLSAVFLQGCILKDFNPEEWSVEPELTIDSSGKIFSSTPTTDTIRVSTNFNEIYVSTDQPDWCKATAYKKNAAVIIDLDGNYSASQRQATITVTVKRGNKSASRYYSVFQSGGKWDIIEGTDIRLHWSYEISESQQSIIKNQLANFVAVYGGTFIMGAQNEDSTKQNYYKYNVGENEWVHSVTLSDFYIGKYEVTQDQWAAIMETDPSYYKGVDRPVENITRAEAIEYVRRLSQLTGLDFALPTSAQWEYAARGGQKSLGYIYSGSDNLEDVASITNSLEDESSPLYATSPVGKKRPNELGIYDMSGNVWEMCIDWYGAISLLPQTDPIGPNSGICFVKRGGAFNYSLCEVFRVFQQAPSSKDSSTGFRLVMKGNNQ